MPKKKYDFITFKGPSIPISSKWAKDIKKYLKEINERNQAMIKLDLFGKPLSKREERLWRERLNDLV